MYGRCCVDNWDGKPVAKEPLFVKVVGYTGAVLVGLSDEFWELKKTIAANVQASKHCCVPDLKYRYSAEAVPIDFCHKGLAGIFEVLLTGFVQVLSVRKEP